MAKYDDLKAAIKQAIKQNGNQEITGNLLQSTLLSMVDSLGENKEFLGFASPSTNPGTPKGEVFYFASGANEYVNFPTSGENETVVTLDGLNIIYNNTSTGFWNWKSLVEIAQAFSDKTDATISAKVLKAYSNRFFNFYTRFQFVHSDFKLTKVDDDTYHIKCDKNIGLGNVASFDNSIYSVESKYIDLDIPKSCHVILTASREIKAITFSEAENKNGEPALDLIIVINGTIIYNALVQNTIQNTEIAQAFSVLSEDGTGDFTNLADLYKSVKNNSIVFVKKGRYSTKGFKQSKGLHFIGISRNDVIFLYSTGLYSDAPILYNGTYENITFLSEAANVTYDSNLKPGYAVHIDFMERRSDIDFSCYFNNCRFISYCSTCVGVGMRKDFELRFNNCEFEYKGKSNENMADIIDARADYKYSCLAVHNVANTTSEELLGIGTVKLQSCILRSDFNATLTFHDNFAKAYPTDFIINNCSFISDVSHKNCIFSSEFSKYITEFNETGCTLNALSHGNNIPFLNS